jgi:glutamate synthase domain-containing protein 1
LRDCKAILERLTKQRGLEVVGWRPVPVDNSMLGQDPLDSEPNTEQVGV